MATLLVVYATREGQTRLIAEAAAARAREAGHRATLFDPEAPREPGTLHFDAVLVAAPVHYGKHPAALRRFVREHRAALESVPGAFLSVCMSAAGTDAAARAEAARLAATFLAATGWRPGAAVPVAGALRYSRYGPLKRLMLRRIAAQHGLPTDTSRDHEFTDWEALRGTVDDLLARAGAGAPRTEAPAAAG